MCKQQTNQSFGSNQPNICLVKYLGFLVRQSSSMRSHIANTAAAVATADDDDVVVDASSFSSLSSTVVESSSKQRQRRWWRKPKPIKIFYSTFEPTFHAASYRNGRQPWRPLLLSAKNGDSVEQRQRYCHCSLRRDRWNLEVESGALTFTSTVAEVALPNANAGNHYCRVENNMEEVAAVDERDDKGGNRIMDDQSRSSSNSHNGDDDDPQFNRFMESIMNNNNLSEERDPQLSQRSPILAENHHPLIAQHMEAITMSEIENEMMAPIAVTSSSPTPESTGTIEPTATIATLTVDSNNTNVNTNTNASGNSSSNNNNNSEHNWTVSETETSNGNAPTHNHHHCALVTSLLSVSPLLPSSLLNAVACNWEMKNGLTIREGASPCFSSDPSSSDSGNTNLVMFRLLAEPKEIQRKAYANESRFLLPNPLVIQADPSIVTRLLHATASVALLAVTGTTGRRGQTNDQGVILPSQYLGGQLRKTIDPRSGKAAFSLKCLLTTTTTTTATSSSSSNSSSSSSSSERQAFRLMFAIRYRLVNNDDQQEVAVTSIVTRPFKVVAGSKQQRLAEGKHGGSGFQQQPSNTNQ